MNIMTHPKSLRISFFIFFFWLDISLTLSCYSFKKKKYSSYPVWFILFYIIIFLSSKISFHDQTGPFMLASWASGSGNTMSTIEKCESRNRASFARESARMFRDREIKLKVKEVKVARSDSITSSCGSSAGHCLEKFIICISCWQTDSKRTCLKPRLLSSSIA